MKNIFILSFIFCFSNFLSAQQDSESYPIDAKMDRCITENGSTQGMNQCMETALQEWDKELNKYYKLLQGVASPEQKAVLQDVQRSWIAYKDKEIKLISVTYGSMEGTMWTNVSSSRILEITRARSLQIKSLYEDMKQE